MSIPPKQVFVPRRASFKNGARKKVSILFPEIATLEENCSSERFHNLSCNIFASIHRSKGAGIEGGNRKPREPGQKYRNTCTYKATT